MRAEGGQQTTMPAALLVVVGGLVQAYYPLSDIVLDCGARRVVAGVGTTANGVFTSPGGKRSVRVINATAKEGVVVVDPIVWGVGGVTVCGRTIHVDQAPRWCTAGDVKHTWICPSPVDSSECWTQDAAHTLDWTAEYAVSFVGCGEDCITAVTYEKPGWFDDTLALAVCAALLAIAIGAPAVIELVRKGSPRARGLMLNWAFACTTLAAMHERLPLQPLWAHGLLAATAAATLAQATFAERNALRGALFEPLVMALIAATLPSRSLGESATRIVRFVLGLGLCVGGGYAPSPRAWAAAAWAVTATIYPVVVTAGKEYDEGRDIAVTVVLGLSAAVGGWASNYGI